VGGDLPVGGEPRAAPLQRDAMAVALNVNGQRRTVQAAPATPLLYVLRNDLELNAAKFGCGVSQCGACTVLVDGEAMPSCALPISAVVGKKIVTLEGLGLEGDPHPLQKAFIAEQAAQCGYCIAGMIMAAKALLDANPRPTEMQIRRALAGNLCRCGTHNRIVRAVQRAARDGV
jgi:nicotinate dehydrogenase subunit A